MNPRATPVRFVLTIFVLASLACAGLLVWRTGWPWLLAWLVPANVVAFVVWFHDRRQARRDRWRVPEAALHGMALLGAVPGSFAAMYMLRHKTLKVRFRWLYGLFLVLQIGAYVWARRRVE